MEAADVTRPCSIGTLPTELLLLILSHLEMRRGPRPDRVSEDGRQAYNSQILKTLHNLTLTCQKFGAITTRLLYCSIVNTSKNPNTALYLLRTLDLKPQLATCIKYIEYPKQNGELPEPVTCYSKGELDWIQNIFAKTGWTIEDMERIYHRNKLHDHFDFWKFDSQERVHIGIWYQISRMRDGDHAFFALMAIMMLAPNLSEIAAPSTRALLILAFKTSKDSGLQQLCIFGDPCQDNHIVLQKNKSSKGDHALENFLLRYLHFQFLDSYEDLEVHLDDLSLDVFDTEMVIVAHDMQLCTSVRSLSCRWREDESARLDPSLSPYDMALPLLGRALLSLEHSLESLTIETLDCAWPIDMESDISPLGSLRSFRVLKHLDVSGLVLLGDYDTTERPDVPLSSILPESLEILKVDIEWDDEIEEVLYAYLSDCALFQPALRSIECSWRPAPKAIAKHLIASYDKIGVKLILAIAPT